MPVRASNWRSRASLTDCLRQPGVVGIASVDTRRLTRRRREKGAMAGAIVAGADIDADAAVAEARAFPGLAGMDLARVVSAQTPYEWTSGPWTGSHGFQVPEPDTLPWRVVAYDFGTKRNILRTLIARGCRVEVVPARTSAREVLSRSPHGVFLSNGPGDPEPCTYAVEAIRHLLEQAVPIFGICLGHQLLARGTVFVSVRDGDKHDTVEVSCALRRLGCEIVATRGTTCALDAVGVRCRTVNKVREGRPHIVDMLKNGEIDMIVNTTENSQAIADSRAIRRTALQYRVPYFTTMAGARALVEAMHAPDTPAVHSMQEIHMEAGS